MANYESRLERLEQQAAIQTGDLNGTLLYVHDSDERPYDCVKYRETYESEFQVITRKDGESWPELKERALSAWGLSDKRLLPRVHFVASNGRGGLRFTDAEYEAIGVQPQ